MTPALLVDLLVLLTVVLAAVHGLRAGAGVTVLGMLGGIAGLVVGRRIAAEVGALAGPWTTLITVLVAIGLGWALGAAVGGIVKGGLRGIGLGWLDSLAGAVVRAGLALVVCWLLALAAIAFGSPSVANAARGSVLVQTAGERLAP